MSSSCGFIPAATTARAASRARRRPRQTLRDRHVRPAARPDSGGGEALPRVLSTERGNGPRADTRAAGPPRAAGVRKRGSAPLRCEDGAPCASASRGREEGPRAAASASPGERARVQSYVGHRLRKVARRFGRRPSRALQGLDGSIVPNPLQKNIRTPPFTTRPSSGAHPSTVHRPSRAGNLRIKGS